MLGNQVMKAEIRKRGISDFHRGVSQIWSSLNISAMRSILVGLVFRHHVACMRVERHGFLQPLCSLYYIFVILYRQRFSDA